ncbi:hypothetical protein MKX01_040108 [Papaver californicum]|nr:hypothetical protein MKX01_040108 [Papaver californicum]
MGRKRFSSEIRLSSDILSWFTQTKEPLYIDDLEEVLSDTMTLSFNVELDDGSEKELAEELMIMHEECLQQNYELIQKLRVSKNGAQAVSQSRQLLLSDVFSIFPEEFSQGEPKLWLFKL